MRHRKPSFRKQAAKKGAFLQPLVISSVSPAPSRFYFRLPVENPAAAEAAQAHSRSPAHRTAVPVEIHFTFSYMLLPYRFLLCIFYLDQFDSFQFRKPDIRSSFQDCEAMASGLHGNRKLCVSIISEDPPPVCGCV